MAARSVTVHQISLWFIYLTGNIFDEGRFMYRVYWGNVLIVALGLVKSLTALAISVGKVTISLKLTIDVVIGFYIMSLVINFGLVREDAADLLRSLRGGLSNYTSYEEDPENEEIKKIRSRLKMTEKIMLSNNLKALVIAFCPIFYNEKYFPMVHDYVSLVLGDYTDSFIRFFDVSFNCLMLISRVAFHNVWEVILVNTISRLSEELIILGDSVVNIDQRARGLYETLQKELEDSCMSLYLRPQKPKFQLRPRQKIEYDDKMEEACLFECLKENIRHHQALIETTAKLNRVVGVCSLMYKQTVGISVGICLFLIAQADHILSPSVIVYGLILVPTMMSQGLVCAFGQQLLDKSDDLHWTLFHSRRQGKSKRYLSCLRIMMLRSNKPLCLKDVFFVVNNTNYVEFLKAGYSFLNFLLTINSSKSMGEGV